MDNMNILNICMQMTMTMMALPLSIPQPMRGTKVGKVSMTHPRAAPQYMGQKLGMQGIWLNGVVTEIRKTIWRYPAQRVN